MKIARRERKKARIEMIPLIDVVFLLLVAFIFFAMSMTVYRGIPVDLPVSSASRVGDQDFSEITVAGSGVMYFNGEEVDLRNLRLRLVRLHRESPEMKIFVAGHREAPYESIIAVIDAVRGAGIAGLSLRTKLPDKNEGGRPEQAERVGE